MPPLCETVSVETAWHEFETPEYPPAVSHSCCCCVSVGTLIPVLLILWASAMCPLPIALAPTNTTASAAIATSTAVFCCCLLYFSFRGSFLRGYHSTMLYLRCFTSSANNIVESVDIFEL